MKLLETTKDVVQTYLLTEARYKFSVYEKRVMYAIIELLQAELKGQKLKGKIRKLPSIRNLREITLQIKDLLIEDDQHYNRIIKALEDLESKRIKFDDGNIWKLCRIIHGPKVDRGSGIATFELDGTIYEVLRTFTKGYTVYDLEVARNFNNVYSMRMYELICHFKDKPTFEMTIKNFRLKLGIVDKYKKNKDIRTKILDFCRAQLKKYSPYYYEYEFVKFGRQFHKIIFKVKYNSKKDPAKREIHKIIKQLPIVWQMSKDTIKYLQEHFQFSTKELSNHHLLFEKLNKEHIDIPIEIRHITDRMSKKKNITNRKGYLINALKNLLEIPI